MDALDFDRLRAFAGVYETGGFSAAALRLGMAKSRISLLVGRLEADLGTALFRRTTRRVAPTEAGEALYRTAMPPLHDLAEAVRRVRMKDAALAGRLRITVPADYAAAGVAPLLATFAEQHPGLEIELIATDQRLDLLAEGIDLAIRLGSLKQSAMKAVRLGRFGKIVAGSPRLIAARGLPRTPAELAERPWVALSGLRQPLTWTFTHADGRSATVRMTARLKANAIGAVLELLRAGAGYSVLPEHSFAAELAAGRLVRVLPDWRLADGGIYAVYPGGRPSPKVRALIDFLKPRLRA